jgi:uncharacterized protein (DUF952 family)
VDANDDPTVATRPGGTTYHLSPEPIWEQQQAQLLYTPEQYETDGFIHCTDGDVNLLAVANQFYRADHRPYVAVEIDLDHVTAPVRYEDEHRIYPHIHGPLNREAVIRVRPVVRGADGSFVELP